ncbi:MAG: cytidylyltransferase domain-containing protein, partial [Geminicoccaceae bacterium]
MTKPNSRPERRSPPEVVAFVHAKGQSTRVPGKNMRRLGDAPMFCHAIRNALACELIDLVVIDSENDEILAMGERYGAVPLKRPAELASNAASGDDLMYWQASNYKSSRLVMQAVPTAPFIRPETYASAIRAIDEQDVDSVCAVGKEAFYPWKEGRPAYFRADGTIPNSFELEPLIFETTGLYVTRTAHAL